MPALIAPESAQTQEGFVPAGFQNWIVRLNRHWYCAQAASTAPLPSGSFRCCALRSSLRCWCSSRWTTPLGHRFPACYGPPAAPAPSAPASTRGDSIPLEGRVTPPGRWLRFGGGLGSTRTKGRGGTRPSMSGRHLRGREAFGVRQLAGAVEAPHCCRRPTAPRLRPTDATTF